MVQWSVREGGDGPGGVGAPVAHVVGEGPGAALDVGDGGFALGAGAGGDGLGEQAVLDHSLQFVLVLPAPVTLGVCDDVEPEIARIEAEGRATEGLFEVYVPAEEFPGGRPPDPGCPPLARDHEHELVPAVPDAIDQLVLAFEPGAWLTRHDGPGEDCGGARRQPERDEFGGVLDDDHRLHVADDGSVLATLGNERDAVEDRLTALKAGWLAGRGHAGIVAAAAQMPARIPAP